MMATGVIHSGVCGFTINVKAVCDDGHKVKLEITSDCPIWGQFIKRLPNIARIPVVLAFQGL